MARLCARSFEERRHRTRRPRQQHNWVRQWICLLAEAPAGFDVSIMIAIVLSLVSALAGPPLRSWAHHAARPVNLGEASFRRWTPSPSHIRPEGNEYMLPNSFDGLSAEQLETGPGLSTSLPNGQARSPKFSRILGFDA